MRVKLVGLFVVSQLEGAEPSGKRVSDFPMDYKSMPALKNGVERFRKLRRFRPAIPEGKRKEQRNKAFRPFLGRVKHLGDFLKNPDAPAPLAHGAKPLTAKICRRQMFPARFRLYFKFKKRPAVTNAPGLFILSQPLKAIRGKQTLHFFPPPGSGLSGLFRVNEYHLTFF
jgi:hypothetical protein